MQWSKRRRLLAVTGGLGGVFVVTTTLIVFSGLRAPDAPYQRGQTIEGLTSELARDLPPDFPRVTFVDVAATAGISFQHFDGVRSSQLPEDMGSGAAWCDVDNDGWMDLFITNVAGPLTMSNEKLRESTAHSVLYRNNGDGTFHDVSVLAGVDHRGRGMAASCVDYDNDGWNDLFITAYGENVLYHNAGGATFTDRTREAGLATHRGFWAGASWSDFNRDGFLDLYVTGYVKYDDVSAHSGAMQYDVEVPASLNPTSFAPERNMLYRNNGDGSFTEMAARAGVLGEQGRSLEATWADFDDDGWPDLYVANDVSDNVLYHNLGNESFEDISHEAWVADYRGAMGIAVGDWDADGDMDMFVTHWIAQENALYSNLRTELAGSDQQGPTWLRFADEADRYGLGQIALDFVGWGTAFQDYDNDGRLDLIVVNGSTFQRQDDPRWLIPMRDQVFWNRDASDGFYDVSLVSGEYFHTAHVGRGAAFADYDRDGDIDALIVNHHGSATLLRNDGGNRGRWLQVLLEGRRTNRSAIGAKLRLFAGPYVQLREIGVQSSYLSQNSLVEHFGLGAVTGVDSLEIRWPSGIRQVMTNLASNQVLRITEPER